MLLAGIDPGNNIAIAIGEVHDHDYINLNIVAVPFFTLSNTYFPNVNLPEFSSNEMRRVVTMDNVIDEIMVTYPLDGISCEEAYIHPQRPQAAAAIVTYVSMIEYRLLTKYNMRLQKIHNRVAKKNLGVGTTSKEDIRAGVLANPNIVFDPSIDKHNLLEHQYDAIGILWSYKELLYGIL